MPAFRILFLSADGNYKKVTGETGYLGLQGNMEEELRQGSDVITNVAVPGKAQLLVLQLPRPMEVIRDLNMMRLPLPMRILIS